MTALVLRGDAAHLPLPDASVDLIVTSPPYYGLRSYTDGGEHYDGQIGSEATPAEYVAALVACTREWCRVLKPSGSLFVNLGDKYGGSDAGSKAHTGLGAHGSGGLARRNGSLIAEVPSPGRPKSLLGLPWRYALAAVDQLGLILRAEIIWAKPNGLPESVTDRVRRSHEQWFHLVRQPRYYAAVDEIREAHADPTDTGRGWKRSRNGRIDLHDDGTRADGNAFGGGYSERHLNPLGKLPGSVWTIPSQPLTVPPHLGVDHFAAFPMELPRRIIQGWSPPGICCACGEGRRPVADGMTTGQVAISGNSLGALRNDLAAWRGRIGERRTTITGYACGCPQPTAPIRPAVVLDPFGGTGTTALIATALGRTGISIDRSGDYSRLAKWRTTDPGQRASALLVDKPPAQVDGQGELFAV